MTPHARCHGLCALAALGGATLAFAEPPIVVRTPAAEVIVKSKSISGGSTTVISNSGNGFGNRIVVSGSPGTTIVKNARNGFGNRLILDQDELLIDLDDVLFPTKIAPVRPLVVEAKPIPPVYSGKANAFWTKKAFSDAHDCNLYWSAEDKLWYRYSPEDDKYRPVAQQPAAPQDD